jgi:hypothetical protein
MITVQDLEKKWQLTKNKIENTNDWDPYIQTNITDYILKDKVTIYDADDNYFLKLDHQDPLVNDLRNLWNTRYIRYEQKENEEIIKKEQDQEKLFSLVAYNTFKVHPSYFGSYDCKNNGNDNHSNDSQGSEYFSYSMPKKNNLICARGVRKVSDKNNHELALLNKGKVGRPRKDKTEKKYCPKTNIKGRPKNSIKKTYLQLLKEQEKLYSLTNMKDIKKMLKKPYKTFRFKKTWKIKKSEWKRISKIIEPIIKLKIKNINTIVKSQRFQPHVD